VIHFLGRETSAVVCESPVVGAKWGKLEGIWLSDRKAHQISSICANNNQPSGICSRARRVCEDRRPLLRAMILSSVTLEAGGFGGHVLSTNTPDGHTTPPRILPALRHRHQSPKGLRPVPARWCAHWVALARLGSFSAGCLLAASGLSRA